jgi:hypothetical protein
MLLDVPSLGPLNDEGVAVTRPLWSAIVSGPLSYVPGPTIAAPVASAGVKSSVCGADNVPLIEPPAPIDAITPFSVTEMVLACPAMTVYVVNVFSERRLPPAFVALYVLTEKSNVPAGAGKVTEHVTVVLTVVHPFDLLVTFTVTGPPTGLWLDDVSNC